MAEIVKKELDVTANAAKKLKELLEAEKKDPATVGLRVGITGGGCSGFQYLLDFDTKRDGDTVVEADGIKVFVDPKSMPFLRGSTVDYVESLMGAGFTIRNPNVKGSCGCGQSFNV